ncbi:MAG: hypothetical protein ACKVQK_15575 [Burkholderiales bacterium]
MSALSELIAIQRKHKISLDDESLVLLAHLRENQVFNDASWESVKTDLAKALEFLIWSKKQKPRRMLEESGPIDANWIKIVRVRRATGYELPCWACLSLNHLFHPREDKRFWKRIGRFALEVNVPALHKETP